MQLRAYDRPPFRAQEFLTADGPIDFTLIPITPQVPIPINGNAVIPTGYRAVVTQARLKTMIWANLGYSAAPPTLTEQVTWTMRRNGVAIPGFLNRPTSWGFGNITGELAIGPAPSFYTTNGISEDYDLIVPLKLIAGDSLTIQITNASGLLVAVSFMAQGWFWPSTNDQDNARGWLADEIEA